MSVYLFHQLGTGDDDLDFFYSYLDRDPRIRQLDCVPFSVLSERNLSEIAEVFHRSAFQRFKPDLIILFVDFGRKGTFSPAKVIFCVKKRVLTSVERNRFKCYF